MKLQYFCTNLNIIYNLLLLLNLPQLLLLLESLCNFLPKCRELHFLLGLELGKQVSYLAGAQYNPLLVFFPLDLGDLPLDFVCPDVVLLLGELFLHFAEVDDLTRLSFFQGNGLFNHFLELCAFVLMLFKCFSFNLFGLGLVF